MLLPGAPPEASPHRGSLMPWALEGSSLAGGGGWLSCRGTGAGTAPVLARGHGPALCGRSGVGEDRLAQVVPGDSPCEEFPRLRVLDLL